MVYLTHLQIKTKILKALDLEDETFISEAEMLDYHNEALDECEAEIHSLHEDYFLSESTISLVSGTATYNLPSDIYANKIRAVTYVNGTTIYPVEFIRERDKFENIELVNQSSSTDFYRYYIINNAAQSKPQLKLVPAARETGSDLLKIRYIRNVKTMTQDSDSSDIPEFNDFVIEYIKMKCYEKEGHANYEIAVKNVERKRELMQDTLSNMILDQNNLIEMDLDFYKEHS